MKLPFVGRKFKILSIHLIQVTTKATKRTRDRRGNWRFQVFVRETIGKKRKKVEIQIRLQVYNPDYYIENACSEALEKRKAQVIGDEKDIVTISILLYEEMLRNQDDIDERVWDRFTLEIERALVAPEFIKISKTSGEPVYINDTVGQFTFREMPPIISR